MRFADLHLIEPLLRAVSEEGYVQATPIQAQAIPHVLAGRDLLGLAQTGTGKTAAFALPILQRLTAKKPEGKRPIRCLVVTPTRELASQIGESFATYGRHLGFRHTVIFGGVGQRPQEEALRRGIDVLVATPGRFLDLHQQRFIRLEHLEVFVLDEADRMLDMGFLPDVKRVIATLPKQKQTLFFSATMPPDAQRLADVLLHQPAKVSVVPPATTAEKVEQGVYFVEKGDKRELLAKILSEPAVTRALVFTRTKHGANKVADQLGRAGIHAEAIHGNKSQGARERALEGFKTGRVRVLVATDIAARGIDVEEISHVVNFDLPNIPETYVHRIGRTARAGASGVALSLCDREERAYLHDIERLTRLKIPVIPTPPLQGLPREAHERGHEPRHGGRRPDSRSGHRSGGGSRSHEPRKHDSSPRPHDSSRAPVRLDRPAGWSGNRSYESSERSGSGSRPAQAGRGRRGGRR